jgi:hypothetical protein
MTDWLIQWLTSRSWILLGKSTAVQPPKNFPAVMESEGSKVHLWSLSWATWIQCTTSQPIYLRSILVFILLFKSRFSQSYFSFSFFLPKIRMNTCSLLCVRRGLRSLWLYKENNKLRDWKKIFIVHMPFWGTHTYDFVVLTSLTHPRKIHLVVLQIRKAKDLSAPLRNWAILSLENINWGTWSSRLRFG